MRYTVIEQLGWQNGDEYVHVYHVFTSEADRYPIKAVDVHSNFRDSGRAVGFCNGCPRVIVSSSTSCPHAKAAVRFHRKKHGEGKA